MTEQPDKLTVEFSDLPEGVEVDTNDQVDEVEEPSMAELEGHLQDAAFEFDAGGVTDDEDIIGETGAPVGEET